MSKARKIQKKESAMSKYLTDKDLQMKQAFRLGDMVEGVVVNVSHEEILVDIGANRAEIRRYNYQIRAFRSR